MHAVLTNLVCLAAQSFSRIMDVTNILAYLAFICGSTLCDIHLLSCLIIWHSVCICQDVCDMGQVKEDHVGRGHYLDCTRSVVFFIILRYSEDRSVTDHFACQYPDIDGFHSIIGL